jgi:membrane-associated protease RseP (regulator of RpoE activity)
MGMRSATGDFSRKGRIILLAAALLAAVAALGTAGGKKEAPAPAGNGTSASPLVASPGVLVTAVQAGSPADKAGIQRGDIILEADGKAVNTPPELAAAIEAHKAGDTMALQLHHGDTEKTVSVSLTNQQGRAWLGIAAAGGKLGLGAGRGFGGFGYGGMGGPRFPGSGLGGGPRMMLRGAGAYVTTVTAGGPAEKAGLVQGDLILSVDGTAVDRQHQLTDIIAAKKAGDTVTLSVQSAAQPQARDMTVTLGKNPDKDAAWLGIQYSLLGPRMGRPFGGNGRGFGGPGFNGASWSPTSPREAPRRKPASRAAT